MAQEPSVGRIVHYVLPSGPRQGEIRPAIITRVWQKLDYAPAPGMSNLTVFRDQSDDLDPAYNPPGNTPYVAGSVYYSADKAPGTWHWPERV